jgi:hypothetical protein
MTNTLHNQILLNAGFASAEHVKHAIAVAGGTKDIEVIKASAMANLEADCINGTITRSTEKGESDQHLLDQVYGGNDGTRRIPVDSGYDAYSDEGSSDGTSNLKLYHNMW